MKPWLKNVIWSNVDSTLIKKETLLSVLGWGVFNYAIIFGCNILGMVIIERAFALGFLLLSIIPNLLVGLIYYVALKRNQNRLGLKTYWFGVSYIFLIYVTMQILAVVVNFILVGQFALLSSGLLATSMMFIVPLFMPVSTKRSKALKR